MKEAIVSKGITVKIVDSPIPDIGDDEVLIKVAVSGSNPKDWKMPELMGDSANTGDDVAGEVVRVGKNVYEFRPGDRVAGFHVMRTPRGSFAEYAVTPQNVTFHIPKTTTFEEAATIPLASATAAVGLYRVLKLPEPWAPANKPIPLVIYGGGTAVGAFAVQLAKRSNIHPLIVVAGKSIDWVRGMLDESRGDVAVDYREGADAVVAGIKAAAKGAPLMHAFDGVSEHGSPATVGRALAEGATLTTVLPAQRPEDQPPATVNCEMTACGIVQEAWMREQAKSYGLNVAYKDGGPDFGHVMFRLMAKGLAEGWFKPHPHRVVPGGLAGVQEGLRQLRDGKASAFKFVFRVPETPGAGKERL